MFMALRIFTLILVSSLLASCDFLDDSFGYRGPIEITIKTSDGSKPNFPFVVTSGYSESCGHGGCGIEFGYNHVKTGFAGDAIRFPREHLDLLRPNAYASITFVVMHPNYKKVVLSQGYAPSKADDPIKVDIVVTPFETFMAQWSDIAVKAKLDMAQAVPDSDDYDKLEIQYRNRRFELGRSIVSHIQSVKRDYLVQFEGVLKQKIIEKYRPIFKQWYFSVPETDCWSSVKCQRQIQKPNRIMEYNGL
ncbi:hypothetical protein L1286_07255 [Pseudoalteromonas sp. SMS1]|uniref:hypothetical protein n=1 Tax=Pseudoalteromonas TaxID=53246 RepID=UPI0007B07752|nr:MULTISPECIES: hypothetical protein [Pseudoalteromonas]KZN28445.1 hypothetical protein N480_10145 [Pseudoalteromonas luteoviolacea S2607]MCF2857260.1 hypothetical protein [Pseudoalteromonas sp. SMS1]